MSKLHVGLNKQVANLSVFFVKLHHFHWYVPGPQFYQLHQKFEEFYDEVNELYDAVAERLLMIGGKPMSAMKDYLAVASIKEAIGIDSAEGMLKAIADDFALLRKEFVELMKVAQEEGDEITLDLLITTVGSFDKHLWMLNSVLAK